MKKHCLLFSTFLLTAAPYFAQAADFAVDPAHSSVGFNIKHLVVANVNGNFSDFTGTLSLDEKDFTKSKLNFVVKTDSISTANNKRDEHLRSPDFFDTKKFPESTFASTSIKSAGKDKYTVEGDLTLHGVTQKTKFNLVSLGKVKDAYGVEKHIFQATTELKRKDFNLTYNAPLESGGMVLGENVKVTIDVQVAPKTVAAK